MKTSLSPYSLLISLSLLIWSTHLSMESAMLSSLLGGGFGVIMCFTLSLIAIPDVPMNHLYTRKYTLIPIL